MTNKLSIIYQNRDFRLWTDTACGQFSGSPGFAKIAPYPPCTVTPFWLKNQDRDRMLRRVTFTPSTAGPLCVMGGHPGNIDSIVGDLAFYL